MIKVPAKCAFRVIMLPLGLKHVSLVSLVQCHHLTSRSASSALVGRRRVKQTRAVSLVRQAFMPRQERVTVLVAQLASSRPVTNLDVKHVLQVARP
eukprot:TRINITY_DN20181_c0_g1_i2.p2 TRINITY_DN20181_c0_g1~~TRINITY_DN20181_c0_g1_i2.p2  ORF type:complete len:105 (+),score=20.24 TRINITY_DN20181_c0_g1_i2:29-316(+)